MITELDEKIKKLKCSHNKETSCIKCNTGSMCIFNDFANMKKQKNCTIVTAEKNNVSSICTSGDMGAPMVANDKLKGIGFTKNIFFTSFAKYNSFVNPNNYYEIVMKYVKNPFYVRNPNDKW